MGRGARSLGGGPADTPRLFARCMYSRSLSLSLSLWEGREGGHIGIPKSREGGMEAGQIARVKGGGGGGGVFIKEGKAETKGDKGAERGGGKGGDC